MRETIGLLRVKCYWVLGVRKNTGVIVIIFYIIYFSFVVLGGRGVSPV